MSSLIPMNASKVALREISQVEYAYRYLNVLSSFYFVGISSKDSANSSFVLK